MARAAAWNPRSWALPAVAAVVDHAAGRSDAGELAQVVVDAGPRGLPMAEQTLVARRLLAVDEPQLARDIVSSLRPVVAARELWGVELRAAEVALLANEATLELEGCRVAVDAWAAERRWLRDRGLSASQRAEVTSVWRETAARRGCDPVRGIPG